jgi:beta-glucanase (GH16 family)
MRHAAAIRARTRSVFALASLVLLLNVTQVASAAPGDGERQSAPRVATSRLDRQRPPIPRIQRWGTPHPPFGILFSRLRIQVTAVTASSISVAWSGWPGRGVVYRVFQDGVPVGWTSNDGYTFTGLSCETSYVLGVVAFRAHGRLPVAAVAIDARTAACPSPPPDTAAPTSPGNVHVVAATASSITIAWDASKDDVGVAGYGVYNGVTRIDSTTATSYTFANLACATGYTLAVDAYDPAGNRSATATVAATTDSCPIAAPPAIAGQGYRLTFADEFNTLDRSVWDDHIWYDEAPLPTWAPTQYASSGILHLVSRRNDLYPGCTSLCYPISTVTTYSSGRSFQYGYFEARMRWTKGPAAWPAFWLLSTGWARTGSCATPAGELDVMEGQGTEPDVLYGTIHRDSANRCGGDEQNGNNWQPVGVDLTAGFHTYAALWTATTVAWYLDDRLIMSAPTYSTNNQPMFLLLQMWSGGWTAGPTPATPFELHTEVDWVRVWQK